MRLTLSMLLAVGLAGCSSVNLPDLKGPARAPSDAGIERYGRYCEQLGNLRGTPEFDRCVRKQEDTYQ
ncbi:MAG: hypothetical protein AB7U30_02585 [Sulfuricellaceae bacterium]|jgi:hypothetical protein